MIGGVFQQLRQLLRSVLFALLFLAPLCNTNSYGQFPITAGELLARAQRAEDEAVRQSSNPAWRRYFRLEARPLGGDLTAQFSLEWWRGKLDNAQSMRVYDAAHKLTAGDWWLAAGKHKAYRLNTALSDALSNAPPVPLSDANVWLLMPCAENFRALLELSGQTVVREDANSFVIDIRAASAEQARGLVRAKLVLRRADLQLTQQTLLVEGAEGIIEYKFNEINEIDIPNRETPPEVVALDAALLTPPPLVIALPPRPTPTPAPIVANTPVTPRNATSRPLAVGSLLAKATQKRLPEYPQSAAKTKISGTVTVTLELDERGVIAQVLDITGPPQLRQAAETAARGWRFAPTIIEGRPVRVVGYLLFKFAPPNI